MITTGFGFVSLNTQTCESWLTRLSGIFDEHALLTVLKPCEVNIKTPRGILRVPPSSVRDRESIILQHEAEFTAPCGNCQIEFDYDFEISHSMRPPPAPVIRSQKEPQESPADSIVEDFSDRIEAPRHSSNKAAAGEDRASIMSSVVGGTGVSLYRAAPAEPEEEDVAEALYSTPDEEPAEVLSSKPGAVEPEQCVTISEEDIMSTSRSKLPSVPPLPAELVATDDQPPVQTIDPKKLMSSPIDEDENVSDESPSETEMKSSPKRRRLPMTLLEQANDDVPKQGHVELNTEEGYITRGSSATISPGSQPPTSGKSVRFEDNAVSVVRTATVQSAERESFPARSKQRTRKWKVDVHEDKEEVTKGTPDDVGTIDHIEGKENHPPHAGKNIPGVNEQSVEVDEQSNFRSSSPKEADQPRVQTTRPVRSRKTAIHADNPEEPPRPTKKRKAVESKSAVANDRTGEATPEEKPVSKKRRRTISEIEGITEGATGSESNTIVVNPTPKRTPTTNTSPSNVKKSRLKTPSKLSKRPRSQRASSKVPPEPKLILSNFDPRKKANAERVVNRLGGEIVDDVFKADILCVPDSQIKKSTKFVLAIILGKHIVSERYIEAAQTSKLFPDPTLYLPKDKRKEREWKFSIAGAVALSKEAKLLDEFHVFMTHQVQKELGGLLGEFETVIRTMGASQVSKRLPSKMSPPSRTIVIASSQDPEATKAGAMGHGIYSKDLIIMAALRGELELGSDEFMLEIPVKPEPESR